MTEAPPHVTHAGAVRAHRAARRSELSHAIQVGAVASIHHAQKHTPLLVAGQQAPGAGVEIARVVVNELLTVKHAPRDGIVIDPLLVIRQPCPIVVNCARNGGEVVPTFIDALLTVKHPAHRAVVEHPFRLIFDIGEAVCYLTRVLIEAIPQPIEALLTIFHTAALVVEAPFIQTGNPRPPGLHGAALAFPKVVPVPLAGFLIRDVQLTGQRLPIDIIVRQAIFDNPAVLDRLSGIGRRGIIGVGLRVSGNRVG